MLKPNDFDLSMVNWAREEILADKSNSAKLYSNLAQLFGPIFGPMQLREKINFFLKRVFPSPEVMAKMYHVFPKSPCLLLYYPLRLKDLLFRHGRTAWRLLRRDEERLAVAEYENKKTAFIEWLTSVT